MPQSVTNLSLNYDHGIAHITFPNVGEAHGIDEPMSRLLLSHMLLQSNVDVSEPVLCEDLAGRYFEPLMHLGQVEQLVPLDAITLAAAIAEIRRRFVPLPNAALPPGQSLPPLNQGGARLPAFELDSVDGVICMRAKDDGGGFGALSLTNAMEKLVEMIIESENRKGGTNDLNPILHPLIYCDSDGNWDEVLVVAGAFGGFRALQTKDQGEAIQRVKQLNAAPENLIDLLKGLADVLGAINSLKAPQAEPVLPPSTSGASSGILLLLEALTVKHEVLFNRLTDETFRQVLKEHRDSVQVFEILDRARSILREALHNCLQVEKQRLDELLQKVEANRAKAAADAQ